MSDVSLRPASKLVFGESAPQQRGADGLSETWIARGGNFAVCVTAAKAGAVLERESNPEEYMTILPPDGAAARFEASGGEALEAEADSLVIVPPGFSRVTARSDGTIVRIFSRASADVMALAANAGTYADGAPELAPPDLWPAPFDGYRLRHYRLADHVDPVGGRMQPRVFRSTNMLVNLLVPHLTRRDTSQLSPHWHDDFEQASLTLSGTWVHHIRYNWGADMGAWRPDDHEVVPTPSVTIIPARAIHTSMDIGEDGPPSSLYDIFCPPRLDFAAKKGFVVNEDEYPLPAAGAGGAARTGGTLMDWQKAR